MSFYECNVLCENCEDFVNHLIEGEAPLNQEIDERNTKFKEVDLNLPKETRINKNHSKEQVTNVMQKGVSTRLSLRKRANLVFISQIEPKTFKEDKKLNNG